MGEMNTYKVGSMNKYCVDFDGVIGLGHKGAVLCEERNDQERSTLGNRADGDGWVDCNLTIVNCLHGKVNTKAKLEDESDFDGEVQL